MKEELIFKIKLKKKSSIINTPSLSPELNITLQNLSSKISSVLDPKLNSSLQNLASTMSVYINILDNTNMNQMPIPKENLLILDSAWKSQLSQLQNTTRLLKKSLESTEVYNLSKTADVLSNNFQNYPNLENFDIPENIEYELDEAYEKASSIAIEQEDNQSTTDKINDSSLSFFDILMIILNVMTIAVSLYGNYQQDVANGIAEEKIGQLESIDNNLDTINNYLEEIVENYDETLDKK